MLTAPMVLECSHTHSCQAWIVSKDPPGRSRDVKHATALHRTLPPLTPAGPLCIQDQVQKREHSREGQGSALHLFWQAGMLCTQAAALPCSHGTQDAKDWWHRNLPAKCCLREQAPACQHCSSQVQGLQQADCVETCLQIRTPFQAAVGCHALLLTRDRERDRLEA